jgi:hypothetical protein
MSTMTIAPSAPGARVRTARHSASRASGGRTNAGRACRDHTPSQVRLTRRGRLVVFLGALMVVLALGVYWGAGSVATERPGTPEPTRVVMVGEGETLWDIAADATTDGNTGAMVERIERLNHLDSGMLTAGQKIRVPASD